MPSEPATTNRLIHEKSPYLLQHAHNPVDWYPWGDEAFQKAADEGKFVLLSIGYATCHWCHVMERESFEDLETAAVLNSVAVAVKVDREERPDVDQVYMAVCQAFHGSGGWPLTVLLTPERKPFFAGTYFPRDTQQGRLGFADLLRRAGALWQQSPDRLRDSADDLLARLGAAMASAPPGALDPSVFAGAVDGFREQYDPSFGGFGGAPKFPSPHNLVFLLRRYRRTGDAEILRMVEETLDAMARGGLHDHLGGGFHRYSTDAEWLVPHFEKMLYDQAGLAGAYLEGFHCSGDPRWAQVARGVFDYVARELTSPEGAFYCAEDADSEGVEGKFYVWSKRELDEALGDDAEAFGRAYGVTEEGNFRDEATREATHRNVLHLPRPLGSAAAELGLSPEERDARLSRCRALLLALRGGRVRPRLDDKVLAGWNGLMIAALANGARILGEPAYADRAADAARFVLTRLKRDGRLLRRWRDGEAAVPAFAEDYAFLAWGLLELYGATFEPSWLAGTLELARDLVRLFWDEEHGGLFDTAGDGETLVLRPKEAYDGATPSPNSVALEVFARLGLLTGDPEWTGRARRVLEVFGGKVSTYPAAFSHFLKGAALLLEPTREVVVCGVEGRADTEGLLAAVRKVYAPETTVVFAPAEGRDELEALASHVAGTGLHEGRAAAYVCEGFACREPRVEPADVASLVSDVPR